MDRDTFDLIKAKYGDHASWAVWAPAGTAPKSNIGDLHVLDPDRDPRLLSKLRPDVVMLGLNLSRPVLTPLSNFHDKRPQGQDFKIRYAFSGTSFYGAYMTDLIKGVVVPQSGNLMKLLRDQPSLVVKGIRELLEEFDDLGCSAPLVIAFGADAHTLAAMHLPKDRYRNLVGVKHYSAQIGKDDYRREVLATLEMALGG
jgi:hypothetical protein